MDMKEELKRVLRLLKKPLSKKDRYLLECKQMQLEFDLSLLK